MCFLHLVFHPVECSYCRSESMMGFRYRCQQCHGYQLCQSCFWRGHANGPHSNQHQMKEHSSWVRQSPDHFQFYIVFFPFLNNSKVNISLSARNDFTTQDTIQPSPYISCPLKAIQEGFYSFFYSFWQMKLYWLNLLCCHIPPKLDHCVINKGSHRRWIPNPIPFPLSFTQRRLIHEASGLGWHAWVHEILNNVWNIK